MPVCLSLLTPSDNHGGHGAINGTCGVYQDSMRWLTANYDRRGLISSMYMYICTYIHPYICVTCNEWESTGLLSRRQAWWMGLIFAVLLSVIAMEPGSYYLCLAWSCCLTEQPQEHGYSTSPSHILCNSQTTHCASIKGFSLCCNDAWLCCWWEKGAYQNITITPCWCLGTKAFEGEERGGQMILNPNAAHMDLRLEKKRHRCEKLTVYVLTLPSYLSDVTNNTPGAVYPWSFALRSG